MKGETWCCPQCGEENGEEFSICKQCGFENLSDAERETKLAIKTEESQTSVKNEKKGKKKGIVLVAVLLLLLMVGAGIFWWLSIAGIRGLIQNGEYEKAISQTKEKPYCAFLHTEAVEAWVEDLWSRKLYEEAIDVFEQWYEGEDKESRIDALIEEKNNERLNRARQALESGEWQKVYDLLEQVDEGYPEVESLRAECLDGQNKERLDQARQALENGEWQKVYDILNQVDEGYPEVESLRAECLDGQNKERLDQARQALENGEWQKVYDILNQVDEGYPEVESLRAECLDGQNRERLEQAREALENGEWQKVYDILNQVDEGYPEVESLRAECLDGQNKERLDQAREALENGEWQKVYDLLEQVDEGYPEVESLRAECLDGQNKERLEQAREALENGEWQKVYDLLNQVDEGYPEVESLRAECLAGQDKERLAQAQNAYDRRQWNQTLTYLDTIEGALPEAEKLRTGAIWNIAVENLRSGKTKEAEDYLGKIPELPEAQTYLKILQLLKENRTYEAAQEAQKIPKTVKGLSSGEWKSMIQKRAEAVYKGAELELQIAAINRSFSGYSNQTAMNPDVPYQVPVRQNINGTILSQEDMFDLLKNCKGNGNKKTLILWDMVPYRGSSHSYCLAGDVMQSLPENMFPSSWEEVEYIITLCCTAAGESAYYQTAFGRIYAVTEQLRASVRKASNPGGLVYSGQTIRGERAPDTFSFNYNIDYPFVSSGLPDCVMEQVALMVDYIQKH